MEPRIFQLLVLPCQQAGCRCAGSWERTEAEQLTQTGQRNIPYCVHPAHCGKAGGRGDAGSVGPRICPAFLEVPALSAYQWNVAK